MEPQILNSTAVRINARKVRLINVAREVILCRAFCVVVDNRNGMAEHCVGLRLEIISRISIGTKYFCCFDVGKLFVKFVQVRGIFGK